MMTTKSNLEKHLIELNGPLCAAMFDAVLVTLRLGLQYLWVNALCIIQDDHEHKLEQTALLGKTFGKSYVTIIANSSKNSDYSFLEDNLPRSRFELPCRAQDGQLGNISLTAVQPQKNGPEIEQLELKAWAYQEFVLSKRWIKYNRTTITWTCNNEIALAAGHHYWPSYINKYAGIHAWVEHISIYGSKEMADPCDKLPAISSLAAQISLQMPRSRYLAGIFNGQTHHQLCWYAPPDAKRLIRPRKWRAPSWSPFAVDGSVKQWHCYSDKGVLPPFLVENNGEYHAPFEILESGVEVLSATAPFGCVKSGFLQVRAQLIALRKDTLSSLNKMGNILEGMSNVFEGLGLPMESTSRKGRLGTIYFDTVNCIGTRIVSADWIQTNYGALSKHTELFAMKICKKKVTTVFSDQDSHVTTYAVKFWDAGLVLAKLDGSDSDFHRVGWFLCSKKEVFPKDKYMQVLRIV